MLCRVLLVSLLSSALPLLAQTNFGRISGTVTDPTGAAVTGANVVIRNTDTQATRTEKTDDHGFYAVENLPIGPYAVEVNHPGFKRNIQPGYTIVADGHISANVSLQMGESSQTVEVTAAPGRGAQHRLRRSLPRYRQRAGG